MTEYPISLYLCIDASVTGQRKNEGKNDRRNFRPVPGNIPDAVQRSSSFGKGGDEFGGQNRGRTVGGNGNGNEGVDRKRGRDAEMGWGEREGDRGRERDSRVGSGSYPLRVLGGRDDDRDRDRDRDGTGRGHSQGEGQGFAMGGDRDGDREKDRHQAGRPMVDRSGRGAYGAIRGRGDTRGV